MESTPFLTFCSGISSGPGIICGTIWGSFAVRRSFAGRDHCEAVQVSYWTRIQKRRIWLTDYVTCQTHIYCKPLELCTFRRSFLSARRETTSPIKYNPNRKHTVERTTKFPVSPSLLNSVQTLSKSMGFGATKMFPPKAERWVHRQWSFPSVCFHPTFKESNQLSVFINV